VLKEMEIFRLTVTPEGIGEGHQLVLREKEDARRCLPIEIGLHEAMAIEARVYGQEARRPMTHNLIISSIGQLDARVVQVEIYKLQESTFFAWLVLDRNGEEIRVDCRPSDSIAVSIISQVPIYVEEQVLQDAAFSSI
jgi:uncharacterized protein